MFANDPMGLRWRKSSHSDASTGCVEVTPSGGAPLDHTAVLMRDSKNPQRGWMAVGESPWSMLLVEIKRGRLDLP